MTHTAPYQIGLTKIQQIVWLFTIGLFKLLLCKVNRRNTRWWRYKFYHLICNSSILLSNVNNAKHRPRHALLCYIALPFLIERDSNQFIKHTNRWDALEIAKILDELGFTVDVMDHDDVKTQVRKKYDLLIGFGRADKLAQELPTSTIKIFLGTGSEPTDRDRCIQERTKDVSSKRNCTLKVYRTNPYPAENLKYYDVLACLGTEEATIPTYRRFFDKKIFCWPNHAYDQWIGIPAGKDFTQSRYNYLYFGTSGQILCGLDLLLEVFAKKPHLNLYVCGPFEKEKDFVKCFHSELYETPNIHPIGWVTLGSPQHRDLILKCGMVIAPMCPVIAHGSILVCMGNGLIPVVTRHAAGIDTDILGTTIPSLNTTQIGAVVEHVSNQPVVWHETISQQMISIVRSEFSQAAFSTKFKSILSEVTGS